MTASHGEGRLLGGRYQLLGKLGRGGMGVVWRAHDRALARDVAVKEVLLPAWLDPEQVADYTQRARREARAAGRLSHRGIVTVYDVVEEDGRPWIIMELIPSRSLDKILSEDGPLDPRRAAELGRDLLTALGAAHAAGILHRDVKPGNVLIAEDGRAVLTDFGLALIGGEGSITQTGQVMGSPGFIAPERARGEGTGAWSDLWSLGATIYATVEGRSPYERDDPIATVAAAATQDPDPSRRSGPLGGVLDGLLRTDPAERIGAAEADRLLAAVAAGQATTQPTALRTGRRNRNRVLAGAAAVLVMAVAIGAWVMRPTSTEGSTAGTAGAKDRPAAAPQLPPRPAGLRDYHDRANDFTIAVPRQWLAEGQEPNTTFFYDNARRRALSIDLTPRRENDPLAILRKTKKRLMNAGLDQHYRAIRMERVPYPGGQAAEWEFTWRGGILATTHEFYRSIVTRQGNRYLISWSVPEREWGKRLPTLTYILAAFRPAP